MNIQLPNNKAAIDVEAMSNANVDPVLISNTDDPFPQQFFFIRHVKNVPSIVFPNLRCAHYDFTKIPKACTLGIQGTKIIIHKGSSNISFAKGRKFVPLAEVTDIDRIDFTLSLQTSTYANRDGNIIGFMRESLRKAAFVHIDSEMSIEDAEKMWKDVASPSMHTIVIVYDVNLNTDQVKHASQIAFDVLKGRVKKVVFYCPPIFEDLFKVDPRGDTGFIFESTEFQIMARMDRNDEKKSLEDAKSCAKLCVDVATHSRFSASTFELSPDGNLVLSGFRFKAGLELSICGIVDGPLHTHVLDTYAYVPKALRRIVFAPIFASNLDHEKIFNCVEEICFPSILARRESTSQQIFEKIVKEAIANQNLARSISQQNLALTRVKSSDTIFMGRPKLSPHLECLNEIYRQKFFMPIGFGFDVSPIEDSQEWNVNDSYRRIIESALGLVLEWKKSNDSYAFDDDESSPDMSSVDLPKTDPARPDPTSLEESAALQTDAPEVEVDFETYDFETLDRSELPSCMNHTTLSLKNGDWIENTCDGTARHLRDDHDLIDSSVYDLLIRYEGVRAEPIVVDEMQM